MATVELTRHLLQFFPQLGGDLAVDGTTIAAVEPGFAFYGCDERGRLRRHINVFVDGLSVGDLQRAVRPDRGRPRPSRTSAD